MEHAREHNERRMPAWIAVGGAVLVGVLTALQARINGSLGASFDNGIFAAFVSFSSGLLILLVLCVATAEGRAGLQRLFAQIGNRKIPVWMLLGGLAGALTVGTQSLTVATIGVALFTVGLVAGQTVNGLILDRVGYGPAGVVAVTVPRLVGGSFAIAGVVLCLSGDIFSRVPWWMLLLPVVAGAGIAWQQATNGRLRQRIGNALVATLVNFAGGTIVLAIVATINITQVGFPAAAPTEPWIYLGGAIGVVYIFLSAALVRFTGVLLLGLGSVVGLLAMSVVLDLLWPPTAGPPIALALAAVGVALIGVVVAVVPWRQLRRRPR